MMAGKIKGADIVYSPDDGGWYATLFEGTPNKSDLVHLPDDCPIMGSMAEVETWARQRGATVLLYP